MEERKLQLGDVQETALIPLSNRATETLKKRPRVRDSKAVEIIRELNIETANGAFALGIWDGVRNGFRPLKYFARFLAVLYGMEIYDILFFDWYLLCHSNFFPHFYPETKGIVEPQMFGYNKKAHIVHFIVYIPACAALALGCSILFS